MSVAAINGLKIALTGILLSFLILNVIFSFSGYKYEKHIPTKNRFRLRRLNKTEWLNSSYTFKRVMFKKNTTIKYDYNLKSTTYFETANQNTHKMSIGLQNIMDPNIYNNSRFITQFCQEPSLENGGPITPNITVDSLDNIERELRLVLKPGGAFEPENCISNYHVAIIVPFRDRYAHLSVFLRNIHPFLMRQNITYRIFIVEQTHGKAFNRAALMNVGYLESLKLYPWDCFVFHDVDLLPLDDRNIYNCPRQPRHMSVAIDNLNFKLPYQSIFGGVSSMSKEHFQAVNGFSNSFFGWGGEDDDMSNRIKHANLFISRYPVNIARYMMLKHHKEKANPKRYENLVNGVSKFEKDGLNSIHYELYSIRKFPAFTWYLIELKIIDKSN